MFHIRLTKMTALLLGFGISLFFLSCYQRSSSSSTGFCSAYGGGKGKASSNNRGRIAYNYNAKLPQYMANGIEAKGKGLLSDIRTYEDSIRYGIAQSSVMNKDLPDVATEYERYNAFEENEWVKSEDEAKSTFSIDVDNAAYTNFRRFVNQKQLPPKDAIRLEEWLNFFNYDLEAPKQTDEDPLKISTEIRSCPWNEEDDLVMIKLQGKKPIEESLPPSNLVFLVDVSGSMNDKNKLPLVQTSMIKLANKLRPEDKMSIVTYAGSSLLALEPTSGADKAKIIKAVNGLTSGGGTAGSDGINTAYELAEKNFMADGNNRIIVATDGDWNISITSDNELKKLIEKKRESGIFLSVLGFGMHNLNDAMMESIADNGNGNYAYIDSEKEATRVFDTEFSGSMYVIAKDVKLQLEFDPNVVEKYRLIGYENRTLENWQFEADSIDAGDLGMGQNVIAFYQISRKEGTSPESLGKIDFRYKPLKSDVSKLLTHEISNESDQISSDFKFASCVVEFAMCLRESEYRGNANMVKAILRGKQNLGDPAKKLSYEKRVEFVGLMERVTDMWEGYVIEQAPEITQDDAPKLKLYPNPASGTTTVEVPTELSTEWSIQIFTTSGALKKVQHFRETTEGKIDLTGLPAQTYLIKVYGGGFNYGYLRLVVN